MPVEMMATEAKDRAAETRTIALVALIQCLAITNSMIAAPLGPILSTALAMPSSKIGLLQAGYVGSACVSGLVGALFLDRFDRRQSLLALLFAFSLATIAAGFAFDFRSLLVARMAGGAVAGPLAAAALALIGDRIAPARRGRAMTSIAAAFSLSSIIGIPIGLQLALWHGWASPFLAVGGLSLFTLAMVRVALPRHAGISRTPASAMILARQLAALLRLRPARLGLAALAAATISQHFLIPFIAPFLVFNQGFAPAVIGWIWMGGGISGFIGGMAAGRLTDRLGVGPLLWSMAGVLLFAVLGLFAIVPTGLPIAALFAIYVFGNIATAVTLNARLSTIPAADARGRYASLIIATQYAATAAGSTISAAILTTDAHGALSPIIVPVILAGCAMVAVPLFAALLERRGARDAAPARCPA